LLIQRFMSQTFALIPKIAGMLVTCQLMFASSAYVPIKSLPDGCKRWRM
jgi:hypothetical protein